MNAEELLARISVKASQTKGPKVLYLSPERERMLREHLKGRSDEKEPEGCRLSYIFGCKVVLSNEPSPVLGFAIEGLRSESNGDRIIT